MTITQDIYIELKLFISLWLRLTYNDHKQYDHPWCMVYLTPDHSWTDWIRISHIHAACTIYIFSQVHHLGLIINIICQSLFYFHHTDSCSSSHSLEGSPFPPETSEHETQIHKHHFLYNILDLYGPYCLTDQSIYYCEIYFNALTLTIFLFQYTSLNILINIVISALSEELVL